MTTVCGICGRDDGLWQMCGDHWAEFVNWTRRTTCRVSDCDRAPRREVECRVLLCEEHAVEYEEHAKVDWR